MINYKDMKDINNRLIDYLEKGIIIDVDRLLKGKLWIPYDRQHKPYEKLTGEERIYYLLLVKSAKYNTTMGFENRRDIIEDIHNFFIDLCNYYNKVYKKGVEELETSFELLNIPAIKTSITQVTYCPGLGFKINTWIPKTLSYHPIFIKHLESIVDPRFVSGEITKALENKLTELDGYSDKERADELRGKILEFIITSDLITG